MPDQIVEEVRKVLREPLKAMPGIIRSGLFKPGASAAYRLGWTGLAIKLLKDFATPEVSVILRDAIPELEKIRNEHPALGRHFSTAISTGYFCAYQPEPDHAICWQL